MFAQKSSIHVPRAARIRGGATPSLWQWMQIICRSENSPPDKVQSIHILNLHPRQVSPGCWLASLSLLLHVPTRERRRLFLQIYIYIFKKKCQIIAPPAETSFNLLFWEHAWTNCLPWPFVLSLPCSELRRNRRCPWRGGTVAKHQIHRLSTGKTRLHKQRLCLPLGFMRISISHTSCRLWLSLFIS